jgi:hypothetical protein
MDINSINNWSKHDSSLVNKVAYEFFIIKQKEAYALFINLVYIRLTQSRKCLFGEHESY